jgi:hypothetical protein
VWRVRFPASEVRYHFSLLFLFFFALLLMQNISFFHIVILSSCLMLILSSVHLLRRVELRRNEGAETVSVIIAGNNNDLLLLLGAVVHCLVTASVDRESIQQCPIVVADNLWYRSSDFGDMRRIENGRPPSRDLDVAQWRFDNGSGYIIECDFGDATSPLRFRGGCVERPVEAKRSARRAEKKIVRALSGRVIFLT